LFVVSTAPRPKFTADDYLAWEVDQRARHEFFHGEVYAMAGSSPRHAKLRFRVGYQLESQLASRCSVTSPDQRVVLMSRQRYVYPM
jgi:Uma2 family endonuclease